MKSVRTATVIVGWSHHLSVRKVRSLIFALPGVDNVLLIDGSLALNMRPSRQTDVQVCAFYQGKRYQNRSGITHTHPWFGLKHRRVAVPLTARGGFAHRESPRRGHSEIWRRTWDSNPRLVSQYRFSRPTPSATRRVLRGGTYPIPGCRL